MIHIRVNWELYRRSPDRSLVALDPIEPRRAQRGYVSSSQDSSGHWGAYGPGYFAILGGVWLG